jgi:hypothetical protein
VILKIVLNAGWENVHWKKSTNESNSKKEQKLDVAFRTMLELVSVFKEPSKNFELIFLLN